MPRRTQQEANEAQALLENPVLKDAYESVREALLTALIETKPSDPTHDQAVRELVAMLRANHAHWVALRRKLSTGNVELFNLEQAARKDIA